MEAPSGQEEPRRRQAASAKRRPPARARTRKQRGRERTELAALRELLFGAERARIRELEQKPGLRELEAEDVGPVLAEAIELRSAEGEGLDRALRAPVEGALERSVERDPDVLATVVAPVMGRALRKAVASAFARATRGPLRFWPVVVAVGVVLTVLVVRAVLSSADEAGRWREAARLLKAEPGFVLVASEVADGGRVFRGLRDPLARDARVVIESSGIDPSLARFEWQPYHSLEPTFALERARAVLAPPGTVTLELRDGLLVAEGQAGAEWIRRARDLAGSVVGVGGLDVAGLADVDLDECRRLASHLESRKVKFQTGSAELDPELSGIAAIEATLAHLDAAASRAGVRVVVEVRPEILPPERGAGLGRERTRHVKERLDSVPRSATLVRSDDEEKIVGFLNGGPEGKLPRVLLKVELVGADER